jgi:hypothetical protein
MPIKSEILGPPDTSYNVIAWVIDKLTTPGLYGRIPERRHTDPAGEALEDEEVDAGALGGPGFGCTVRSSHATRAATAAAPAASDVGAGQRAVGARSCGDLGRRTIDGGLRGWGVAGADPEGVGP